jgi:hypothetical protein
MVSSCTSSGLTDPRRTSVAAGQSPVPDGVSGDFRERIDRRAEANEFTPTAARVVRACAVGMPVHGNRRSTPLPGPPPRGGGLGTLVERLKTTEFVGWVERSETHPHRSDAPSGRRREKDGFRCALPILPVNQGVRPHVGTTCGHCIVRRSLGRVSTCSSMSLDRRALRYRIHFVGPLGRGPRQLDGNASKTPKEIERVRKRSEARP